MSDLNTVWGGRASCAISRFNLEAVSVSNLTPIMNDMCFCTFLADYQNQIFFFSKEMTDAVGLAENEPVMLPDLLKFVPEKDRAAAAREYEKYFAVAAEGNTDAISFQHSFCTLRNNAMWIHVHMQVIRDGESSCIWGAILDKTQTISERILSQLLSEGIDECTNNFDRVPAKEKTAVLQQNIIESSAAVIFIADHEKSEIRFSENLRRILPDAELVFSGSLTDQFSRYVIYDDLCRFTESVEQILAGNNETFSFDFRVSGPDKSEIWFAVRGKSFDDAANQTRMSVGTLMNLNDMVQFKDIIEKTSGRNEITDLPVRKRLIKDFEKVISDRNILSAAVILIDIREFHTYNDRFGRAAGDEILRGISDMIAARLPYGSSLYHINVDHFCVLWPHASRVQAENFMAFLHDETTNPIVVRKENIYAAFAMSAALFPACGCSADELLVNAEITLNKIKRDKRRHYSVFIPADKRELTEKLDFESQLSKSVLNTQDNFLLYYQPIFDARGETLIGAEALLRWLSPSRDIISPERVIAALEATGHMDGVGAWVLEQGICQCSKWISEGINPEFVLHVNITVEDLMRPNYSLSVISLLSKHSLNPGNLILEITETSLMRSVSSCRQNLIRLRKAGIKISLDDFGTGYSSLNYLRELPVDEIKIDRSFLENIQKDRYNHSFISAMIILAHSISRNVCIEGIETSEQAETIRELDADIFQGFFFGKPISSIEFEKRFFSKSKNRN